jgi:hypothetical protein
VLKTFEVQNAFFGLALDKEYAARVKDFTEFWSELPVPIRVD